MIPDMFDGIFDDRKTQRRVIVRDGKPGRYAQMNCCGNPSSPWRELHKPWGEYPDLPSNVSCEVSG